jgi:hypothetical protein
MTLHGWHITPTRRGYKATRAGRRIWCVSYARLLAKLEDRAHAEYLRSVAV